MVELEIHQSKETDAFKDIIKVHEKILTNTILNPNQKKYGIVVLKYGTENVEKLKKKSVWLRTIDTYDEIRIKKFAKENNKIISSPESWILIDDAIRFYFNIQLFDKKNFYLEEIKVWQIFHKLNLNAEHSDPLIRHTFWMTLILGWLSVTISIIAIELTVLLTNV